MPSLNPYAASRSVRLTLPFAWMALILCLFGTPVAAIASNRAPEPDYVREDVLREREFPFLGALLADSSAAEALRKSPPLAELTAQRWERVHAVEKGCKEQPGCEAAAMKFSADEVAQVSGKLRDLYKTSPAMREFTRRRLVGRQAFYLAAKGSGEELLVSSWERSAAALNHLIAVYGEGEPPHYRKVDSMTYDAASDGYRMVLQTILQALWIPEDATESGTTGKTIFFEPTLRFALRLLQANSRDEAGRFWPLEASLNRAAVLRARRLRWNSFPYSVILVPGAGSEKPGVSLSPMGKERLRYAVEAYRAGDAPLILVSGGYVHPEQTPFCEALQMKQYLMQVYRLPESVILVDPYARHTTTNLRNASREVFAYRLPASKAMLIVTDADQSAYITGETFLRRNVQELGYQPVTNEKRLSPTQIEAMPSSASLYVDPLNPLDP